MPAQVRRPYPIVLVHGGGGQGLDWMGTPDGRPRLGADPCCEEGYKVYVVDRPGHGRSPYHPDVDGPFPAQTTSRSKASSGRFTPPNAANRRRRTSTARTTISGRAPASVGSRISIRSSRRRAVATFSAAARPRRGHAGAAGAGGGAGGRGGAPAGCCRRWRNAGCPRADPTRSTWCGVSAARCCSTRSVPRSS